MSLPSLTGTSCGGTHVLCHSLQRAWIQHDKTRSADQWRRVC